MSSQDLQDSQNPQHVAIILDGNRRFAKKLMLQPWRGHEHGAKKVGELLDYAKELGIKQLTFYCLSSENIKSRPENELNYLFQLFKKEFKNLDREKIQENQIKIKFIGNQNLLPPYLQEQCKLLEQQTKDNNNFIVNFAIAYGGRQELIDAVKKILKSNLQPEQINEQTIEENLYLKDEPNLIIRTGGEKRTSNFLPWQSTYSEWFFLDKMWPEFNKQDLINCIEEFKNRKKNFGA